MVTNKSEAIPFPDGTTIRKKQKGYEAIIEPPVRGCGSGHHSEIITLFEIVFQTKGI